MCLRDVSLKLRLESVLKTSYFCVFIETLFYSFARHFESHNLIILEYYLF
jgi:hypothetical protein